MVSVGDAAHSTAALVGTRQKQILNLLSSVEIIVKLWSLK